MRADEQLKVEYPRPKVYLWLIDIKPWIPILVLIGKIVIPKDDLKRGHLFRTWEGEFSS